MLSFPVVFDEIQKKVREGHYEPALQEARRLSIDLLKREKPGQASAALSLAGHVLCMINQPAKAANFSREALALAERSQDKAAAGYALAVGALARLRLAEFETATAAIDRALEILAPHADHMFSAFAQLVAAEISIVHEEYAEARSYAEDAFAIGASLDAPWIQARARLVKAICEDRSGNIAAATELLRTAEQDLQRGSDAETFWLVQSALARICIKSGQEKAGASHRQASIDAIRRIASELGGEARERFVKNPAVVNALGEADIEGNDLWKVPVQIAPDRRSRASDSGLHALRPVLDVIKKINTELNLRKLITMILDTMIEFCNAQRGTIIVFEGNRFKVELSRDRSKEELKHPDIGVSRTVLKLVRDHGRRVVCDDAQRDPQLRLIDSVHDQSLLSILCLPLSVKRRLIGAVYLDNPFVPGAFGPREIEVAEILTDHAAVAIDNALLHIKTTHDGLTKLYNHAHFEERLELEVSHARRHGRPCGVIMLDVDNFKAINDTHGHEAGNEVLRGVARVLSTTLRGVDFAARVQERGPAPIVARYGGDEFEIVLPETPPEGLRAAAERLLKALEEEEFRHGGKVLKVSISIGGAVFPHDAPDARELLLRADEALYAAKRAGKNRVVLHSAGDRPPPAPAPETTPP